MEMALWTYALPLLAYVAFSVRRLIRYLHVYQQHEYASAHFLKWLWSARAFDKRLTAALLLIAAACWAGGIQAGSLLAAGAFALAMVAFAFLEPDPRKDAKKKLVMTSRAKRVLFAALGFAILTGLLAAASNALAAWALAVQAIPLALVLGNWLLTPVEARIQAGFVKEARARLETVKPTIVGITGSFGKTSVKHILGHVLQLTSNAVFTPGSVNTVMGITRFIREELRPGCRFLIVEMGAYGKGSIRRLNQLTPADHGIITSIGEAHYERFKGLEVVAEAKFELAETVVARRGKLVVDEGVLARDYARRFIERERARFVIVGSGDTTDVRLLSVRQRPDGLEVSVRDRAGAQTLFAPLYGAHHGRNVAIVYAMAVELGIAPEKVVAALRSVPQIKHRLEVRRQANGIVHVDDSFNSNPEGFRSALQLVRELGNGAGRRILVTPGIVELGDKHDLVHSEIGAAAAEAVDIALVIGGQRIPTFVRAFQDVKKDATLIQFDRFDQARRWLADNAKPHDIVLIENDLPDIHERRFLS